jgi:hypothetical protein
MVFYLFLPRIASAAESQSQSVRLGNAAMPFGWATAVADLDSDKQLDFAIADRTKSGVNDYHYRLQLTLSQSESQTFQFRSADSALNISIVDLDNDADLDIVLTHAFSGKIAGVWLNNGSGGFQQADTEDFLQANLRIRDADTISSSNVSEAMAGLPIQKKAAFQPVRIPIDIPAMLVAHSFKDSIDNGAASFSRRFISPRSPPANFLS